MLHPLKRTGRKGEGAFTRITWEEALDEITRRMQEIIRRHGAEAILPYSYYGNMGLVNNGSMDRRFFHRLGASRLDRTICNVAGNRGFEMTMGFKGESIRKRPSTAASSSSGAETSSHQHASGDAL